MEQSDSAPPTTRRQWLRMRRNRQVDHAVMGMNLSLRRANERDIRPRELKRLRRRGRSRRLSCAIRSIIRQRNGDWRTARGDLKGSREGDDFAVFDGRAGQLQHIAIAYAV